MFNIMIIAILCAKVNMRKEGRKQKGKNWKGRESGKKQLRNMEGKQVRVERGKTRGKKEETEKLDL